MIRIVLLALIVLPLGAAGQEMYKWVDEKGRTHYSQDPPPEGKGGKVDVKPATPGTPRADDWKQRDQESRQRRAKQEIEEGIARKKEESSRAQNCRRAQQGLDTVKNSRRVYNLDAKGERVYLDDRDRPAETEKWTREVEKYC